ncbi:polycystin-1-like protein 2 [Montipora foliosa]|uniref:polycystin-1-like protein 2 n=1 Tax=Montipora foliosa TaxID=591990 RepID=UPI0035F1111F
MKTTSILMLGAYFWAFQFTDTVEAFFNITSSLLKSNVTFNLTISDSCTADYTVDFGDSTPRKNLNNQQKVVSHAYTSAGNYKIMVNSSSASPGCTSATESVEVRDPIVNMTVSLNSTFCKVGDYLEGITVTVFPVSPLSWYWRTNTTHNWTKSPFKCSEVGENDLFVMAENGISISGNACLQMITVIDFDFAAEVGAVNSSVKITRTALAGVSDESNFTFFWVFDEGEIKKCPNLTVNHTFTTVNVDPGHLVTLEVNNRHGHFSRLLKYVKIYEPVQSSIEVSHNNIVQKNQPSVFVVSDHGGSEVTYQWDFGDKSQIQNTTNRNITYAYSTNGDYCILLSVKNAVSEKNKSFKVAVLTAIGGLTIFDNITTVQTGASTHISVEIKNGSRFNLSLNFGDGSQPLTITNVDDISSSFVISLRHNYSFAGRYNFTVKAWNALNTETASSLAVVQDLVGNLTIQKTYTSECLEVNDTFSVLMKVNGSELRYYVHFGDGKNVTSTDSRVNHSYITHGDFSLNITVLNDISSVSRITNVTVCKPVIAIDKLAVKASPTNISDPVKFNMTLAEGSDFECTFAFGDGNFEHFTTSCLNNTYFVDGVTTDKTPFMNLEYAFHHNYSKIGRYQVSVQCSNRLSTKNITLYSIVQKPIEGLELNKLSHKISGHHFPVNWTMINGTNVTFQLDVPGTPIKRSSLKTDIGDSFNITINKPGVFVLFLHAKNLVSESNHSLVLVVQEDVTSVSCRTWTTTSDWGSGIPGFGENNHTFPIEYPVNFTATPDKGTNLTYWWRFGDGSEQNTTLPTCTHQFNESEGEYWNNVTVFNLVSAVKGVFLIKVERSVSGLAVTDNSPVKVTEETIFRLSFSRYDSKTCVTIDTGDGGLYIAGAPKCNNGSSETKTIDAWINQSISHNYTTVGEFNVTVNAFNTVSREPLVFKSVTTELSCFYPKASILDVGANVSTARKVNRSETVLIQTKNDIDCEASKSTSFIWDIFKISEDPKNFQKLTPEKKVQTGDQPYIKIDATSLDFGFYKLVFTIKMSRVVGISGSAEGYIHIVASISQDSLLPVIDGGPRKRYKFGKTITLNATSSVDEDYANITEANPEYYWFCRNSSDPEINTTGNLSAMPFVLVPKEYSGEKSGGCFGTGAGLLPISGPVGKVDSTLGMTENSTYVITLVLVTHNPFLVKRRSVTQLCDMVTGDPPEVKVSCTQTCPKKVNIDQKMSLKGHCVECFGELTFLWELYQHINASNVDPTDTSKMKKDQNLEKKTTTGIKSLNLVVKPNTLHPDCRYTVIFKAFRGQQYGEFLQTLETNSPPKNGSCEVTPKNGSAMHTLFRINCSGWEDVDLPLTYEFAYERSNKESVFLISQNQDANSLYLPMGQDKNHFNLTLKIKVIDGLGAASIVRISVKVTNISLKDVSTGLLESALRSGNFQKMVEIASSVTSILNFMAERKDKEEVLRRKFRADILQLLGEFKETTLDQVKLMSSSVDVITEIPGEVNTGAQERALELFERMADIMKTESKGKTGFAEIKEVGTSLLSGIANVIVASASLAKDTKETGIAGNDTQYEGAKKRTLHLHNLIDDVGTYMLRKILAGDDPSKANTPNCNLTLKKVLLEEFNLSKEAISNNDVSFTLPTLDKMGIGYETNGTEKYSSIDVKMTSFPSNPFTWSNTSKEVKSFTVGLTLKNESQNSLNTSNFSEDVNIYIPRDASKLPEPQEFNFIPLRDNEYIQYHTVEVNSVNFSVHIQIFPVNESTKIKVFMLYNEKPTLDSFDYNWTIPDFSSCKNVSTNSSSSSNSTAGATDPEDCKRDPYTVSISNSLVTRSGTYYLAVYHKKPEPKEQSEEGSHSPTNSPNAARERREIPLACRGARGRMKRSCVLIPSPPPKPTTPGKIQDGTRAANVDFQGNIFNPNETERYKLRVFLSNCLFWGEKSDNWINKGCRVGEETKPDRIHCQCNHLTSFASDFLVAPNPIDFDKVFSADVGKNPAVIIAISLLFGLYFILVLIARRFDKKDLEKLGATAIRNRGGFPYLISIHTGIRQNAGTTSSVYIVLSGDHWQSSPTALVDHDRKVFQRGQENNFVVTLPQSLGSITHIRIWHDNCGNNASWYLSRISVADLSTEKRWYFICERWLAVEEDDGRVERVLPVASDKELTHFQHLFVSKTVRELGDGHLWFSVITRPPTSPFTRVQRISCCLSLLCLTMLTNALFYRFGETEKSMMMSVGSFQFDLRTFFIGMQASLIIFPVNLVLVQIFRSVRPKKPKQNMDHEANKSTISFVDINRCPSKGSLQNVSRKKCFVRKQDDEKPNIEQDGKAKKKKKGLPHCFVYFAWSLCFLASVTGAVFTVFYSLNWGPEISNKWLIAFLTSFVESILVIQPVKVVLVSLLFALIIRKPLDSNEDPMEKKELKETADGNETGDDIMADYEEDTGSYGPPDDDFLKSAREQRLKEVRMSEILKEISAYFLFVFVLVVVAYGNRDPNAYLLSKNLRDIFVEVDDTGVDLADASDVDLFFHWSRETLIPNLYPGALYNNKTDKYTGFIDDRYNYLVGISRFRQARVKKDSCVTAEAFRGIYNECFAEYSVFNEDKGDYGMGWTYLNKTFPTYSRRRRSVEEQFAFRNKSKHETLRQFGNSHRVRFRRAIVPVYSSTSGRQQRKKQLPGNQPKIYYVLDTAVLPDGSIISCPTRWLHRSALELRGFPFVGYMTLYGGGGYPADLGYDYPTAMTVIADLHSHNWVDRRTRSVFVEFTVYNANVNLFGIAYLFVEFLPTGGAFPYVHFAASRLYSFVGPFSSFILACQILMVLFMFYFMYREGKAIYKQRKAYFHGFFNWMEVITVIGEFSMVILYATRWWQVDKNLIALRHNPKDFVSFQYAGAADEALSIIMGLLVFLVTIRFLKLFRFNKRMSLIGSTIKNCAKPLMSFFVSFMLMFIAYAILAFLVFGVSNENFKTFLMTFETQTSIILGDFDYRNIEETNRVLGPWYFFTFMYFSVFYLLNMFMAIINDAFTDVKASNDKQQNEYEMVEFILSKFKEGFGLNRNRIGTGKSQFDSTSASGFPSSPPFGPSDYKFPGNEDDSVDSVYSVSQCGRPSLSCSVYSGKGVLRAMASLKKNLDQLTSLVERGTQNEEEYAEFWVKLLDTVEKEDDRFKTAKRFSVQ